MPLLTLGKGFLAYGHLPLFDGADLRIEPAERIALIGRNGSGKTSPLRGVSGEIKPGAGIGWGTPRVKIARLEQEVPGTGSHTVFEEVSSGLRGVPDEGGGLAHKVDPVLPRLSLPADRQVQELSGGWRRRV